MACPLTFSVRGQWCRNALCIFNKPGHDVLTFTTSGYKDKHQTWWQILLFLSISLCLNTCSHFLLLTVHGAFMAHIETNAHEWVSRVERFTKFMNPGFTQFVYAAIFTIWNYRLVKINCHVSLGTIFFFFTYAPYKFKYLHSLNTGRSKTCLMGYIIFRRIREHITDNVGKMSPGSIALYNNTLRITTTSYKDCDHMFTPCGILNPDSQHLSVFQNSEQWYKNSSDFCHLPNYCQAISQLNAQTGQTVPLPTAQWCVFIFRKQKTWTDVMGKTYLNMNEICNMVLDPRSQAGYMY